MTTINVNRPPQGSKIRLTGSYFPDYMKTVEWTVGITDGDGDTEAENDDFGETYIYTGEGFLSKNETRGWEYVSMESGIPGAAEPVSSPKPYRVGINGIEMAQFDDEGSAIQFLGTIFRVRVPGSIVEIWKEAELG